MVWYGLSLSRPVAFDPHDTLSGGSKRSGPVTAECLSAIARLRLRTHAVLPTNSPLTAPKTQTSQAQTGAKQKPSNFFQVGSQVAHSGSWGGHGTLQQWTAAFAWGRMVDGLRGGLGGLGDGRGGGGGGAKTIPFRWMIMAELICCSECISVDYFLGSSVKR